MIKISNSKLVSVFTILLFILVVAKALSLAILWYLPSEGIELNIKKNYQPKYQRVDFKNMIKGKTIKVNKKVKKVVDSGISITSMILKGLYGTKTKGYVIVAMKSSPKKTSIVGIGESYQGYTLKSISIDSANFTKGGADFILSLQKVKNSASTISRVSKKSFKVDDRSAVVSRSDISYYAKNPNQIWRDISIRELKAGKKIKGFKVTKINPNSKFAKLGLRRGDIIIKANNIRLQSYRDALEIYNNIDKLDAVQIVVLRNNQEVELVYEIN
jgi:general secretion pathway protein C